MFSNPMFAPPGPAAPAMPSGQQGGMGGGTFTDLLNSLSGNAGGQGFDTAGISDAMQGAAMGIGQFAKNPQVRAAYIAAAQAHAQHKGANADKDYEALISLAPEYAKIAQQAQGRPEILQALMPSLQHWAQNIDHAAKRAGKTPIGGDLLGQIQAAASVPAAATRAAQYTLRPQEMRYDSGGKVIARGSGVPAGEMGAQGSEGGAGPSGATGEPGTKSNPLRPQTDDDYDSMPVGAWFMSDTDGVIQKTQQMADGARGDQAIHQPKSEMEFERLPIGAAFINPADGKVMRKAR